MSPAYTALTFFIVGGFFVSFFWWCWFLFNSDQTSHCESVVKGIHYSTKRAHRIFGTVGERIHNGKWIYHIKSIWMTYPVQGRIYAFMVEIDELKPSRITPIHPVIAIQFIKDNCDRSRAEKLIRDWFRTSIEEHDKIYKKLAL
jgi:hypothetical protein